MRSAGRVQMRLRSGRVIGVRRVIGCPATMPMHLRLRLGLRLGLGLGLGQRASALTVIGAVDAVLLLPVLLLSS